MYNRTSMYNRNLRVNSFVGYMVLQPNRLQQHLTTMSLINKIWAFEIFEFCRNNVYPQFLRKLLYTANTSPSHESFQYWEVCSKLQQNSVYQIQSIVFFFKMTNPPRFKNVPVGHRAILLFQVSIHPCSLVYQSSGNITIHKGKYVEYVEL